MLHNILITGASGYLGGSFLELIKSSPEGLPPHGALYALVRTDEQAKAVKELYGAEPLRFDPFDADAVREHVVGKKISVVFHLIDPLKEDSQIAFIEALGEVKRTLGNDTNVHFLHTSGAKIFSSHAGAPTDRPLLDNDPNLYEIQKAQEPRDASTVSQLMHQAKTTNCSVIEQSEKHGVRAYVFMPCIVYGKGTGFGNPISIQTVAIVKAARAVRRVYRTTAREPGEARRPSWPVCHVRDNSALYAAILRAILRSAAPGGDDSGQQQQSQPAYGRNGYYLAAAPGPVVWDDLYAAMAVALEKRGVVDDAEVRDVPDQETLELMGKALGYPGDFVDWAMGGKCTLTAAHGKDLGWEPQYGSEHILEDASAEVDLILDHFEATEAKDIASHGKWSAGN